MPTNQEIRQAVAALGGRCGSGTRAGEPIRFRVVFPDGKPGSGGYAVGANGRAVLPVYSGLAPCAFVMFRGVDENVARLGRSYIESSDSYPGFDAALSADQALTGLARESYVLADLIEIGPLLLRPSRDGYTAVPLFDTRDADGSLAFAKGKPVAFAALVRWVNRPLPSISKRRP